MSSHALVTTPEERAESRRGSRPTGRGTPGASRSAGALGGEPRVSLLPTEVNDLHRARSVRRRLVAGVLLTLVVVAAGVGGSMVLSMAAQAQLETARAASLALVTQEGQFADLKQAKSGIALIEAGQLVGASTEIAWQSYLQQLEGTLPSGVVITSVNIDSATPFVDYAQGSGPLESPRVATLDFTATSPTLPTIPDWLDGLATLPGFADAVPGTVALQSDDTYIVNITMHINSDAFSLRFAPEEAGQ